MTEVSAAVSPIGDKSLKQPTGRSTAARTTTTAGTAWTCCPYKEEQRAPFKSITRQVLFSDPELRWELRYFEIAAGGFSTLERHEHMHAVLILRGRGHCLIGERGATRWKRAIS